MSRPGQDGSIPDDPDGERADAAEVAGSSAGAGEQFEAAAGGFGNALSWSYVQRIGQFAATTLVALVLARLLGPAAFGTVAMGIVYVYLLELLVRQGLAAAIIQRPGLRREHLDAAFWTTIATVAMLSPVSILLSGWWARANDLPELQGVIVGLTPVLVFKGLSIVQEAQLNRQMDFRSLALRTNAAVVLGGTAGIAAALLGAGVWALVIQQVTMAASEMILLWVLSEWRPRLQFDRRAARELFGFSSRSALASLGVFAHNRSDALLIGLILGPVAVGLYRMAARFAQMSVEVASGAITAVSFPELSRHHRDHGEIGRRTVEIIRLAGTISIPALGIIAVSSDSLMRLLGPEWAPAADALKVLCLFGAAQSIGVFSAPALQAAGHPGKLAWLTWSAALFTTAGFVGGGLLVAGLPVEVQVLGLAASRVGAYLLVIGLVVLPVTARYVGLTGRAVLMAMSRSVAATATGAGIAFVAVNLVDPSVRLSPLLELMAVGFGTSLVVGALLIICEPLARDLVSATWRRVRPRHEVNPPR